MGGVGKRARERCVCGEDEKGGRDGREGGRGVGEEEEEEEKQGYSKLAGHVKRGRYGKETDVRDEMYFGECDMVLASVWYREW